MGFFHSISNPNDQILNPVVIGGAKLHDLNFNKDTGTLTGKMTIGEDTFIITYEAGAGASKAEAKEGLNKMQETVAKMVQVAQLIDWEKDGLTSLSAPIGKELNASNLSALFGGEHKILIDELKSKKTELEGSGDADKVKEAGALQGRIDKILELLGTATKVNNVAQPILNQMNTPSEEKGGDGEIEIMPKEESIPLNESGNSDVSTQSSDTESDVSDEDNDSRLYDLDRERQRSDFDPTKKRMI